MFKHIKVGDVVTRNFYGTLQRMRVTAIDEYNGWITAGMGWMFDPETGCEEDPELGYGKEFGRTISFLINTTTTD